MFEINPNALVGSAADPYAAIDQDEGVYGGTSSDAQTQDDLSALQTSLATDNLSIPNIVEGLRYQKINITPTSTQNSILQATSSFSNASSIYQEVAHLENDAQSANNVPTNEQADMDALLDSMNNDSLSLESVYQSIVSNGEQLTKSNINNSIVGATQNDNNAQLIRNNITNLNNDIGTQHLAQSTGAVTKGSDVAAAPDAFDVTALASFNLANGAMPRGALLVDASGNLFGTTSAGGSSGAGTVFELANNSGIYAAAPMPLISFDGSNGSTPIGGLIADSSGDLFGTTSAGGISGDGTVFELTKSATGYAATPTTLAAFGGVDGSAPQGTLVADASGDLFGTTSGGGASGDGTVFEIAKTSLGYSALPVTLVSFGGADGSSPQTGLVADAAGDLFGTTSSGGQSGGGTVFELTKTALGYSPTPTILASFDGEGPPTSLVVDAAGNLFGTTAAGGTAGDGTVFEIANSSTGYAATPNTLVTFDGSNGVDPSGLVADSSGNLFGTTETSGTTPDIATVFEVTGSGFVVCFAAGTMIRTTIGDIAVERLAVGDIAVTAPGEERPIRWLGHRTIDGRRHPRPREVMPIRIAAHAFGSSKPARDLWVSPGHAICVDVLGEVLIPASSLINGDTIAQVEVEAVTYWHVELDSHDVLLAENLACESYLDMGNRGFFRQAAMINLAAGPDGLDPTLRTHADFCRPFHARGPLVDAARTRTCCLAAARDEVPPHGAVDTPDSPGCTMVA